MASGSIPLSGDVKQATGRISWSSEANQEGNYSIVNTETFVILKGWGIQGTGSGEWYENDELANTFKPKVNVAYGGTGTTSVYEKNNIKVVHDDQGNGSIKLGAEMSFTFAGIDYIKGSGVCTMDTIPRYAEVKLADVSYYDMNSIRYSYTTDATVDKAWYSLDGGPDVLIKDGDHTSNTFTISKLAPNTLYELKVKVRRKDSQLISESNVVTVRTYDYGRISIAPIIAIGNQATIYYTNPSGAAAEICICKGDATVASNIIAAFRSVTSSPYVYTPTQAEIDAMYALVPNTTIGRWFYCIKTTQNGISYYHYLQKQFTVSSTGNTPSAPTNLSYADTNSTVLALTDNPSNILLGFSDVKVSIGTASTAKNKATIKNYSITDGTTTQTIDGTGAAPYSNTIEKVKRNSIEVYVFDSRGFSNKSSLPLTVLDYQSPRINTNISLKRVGGVSSSVSFVFSGYIWNKSFGKVSNSIKYLRYKMLPTTSSNWDSVEWINIDSSKYTIASDGTITNVDDAILPNFTIGTAYNVKLQLVDQLDQTSETTLSINSGEPLVAYNKPRKLVGVGKIPDKTLPQGSIDAKGRIVAGGDINSGTSVDVGLGTNSNPVGYKAGGTTILRHNGAATVISTNGGDDIYFRPNGTLDETGQAHLSKNGIFYAPYLFQNGKRIMAYNGGTSSTWNFDQSIYHGIYIVSDTKTIGGAPYTGEIYGTLEVTVSDCTYWNKTSNWIWQKFRDTAGGEYTRFAANDGTFTPWVKRITTPPLGTVIITSTNTNPSTDYGGEWELIDKEFKAWNGAVTWTETNATATVNASRRGHSIYIKADATTTAKLSDSEVTLGKINPASLGLKAFTYQKYESPFADGANAIGYMVIKADGTIACVDINQAAGNRTIDAGAVFVINFVDVPILDNMEDSVCDKFYWKRIG